MTWPNSKTDEFGVVHYEREPTEAEYVERAREFYRLGDMGAAYGYLAIAYHMRCMRAKESA